MNKFELPGPIIIFDWEIFRLNCFSCSFNFQDDFYFSWKSLQVEIVVKSEFGLDDRALDFKFSGRWFDSLSLLIYRTETKDSQLFEEINI